MVHVRLEPGTFWFNDDETHIDKKHLDKRWEEFLLCWYVWVHVCDCVCLVRRCILLVIKISNIKTTNVSILRWWIFDVGQSIVLEVS